MNLLLGKTESLGDLNWEPRIWLMEHSIIKILRFQLHLFKEHFYGGLSVMEISWLASESGKMFGKLLFLTPPEISCIRHVRYRVFDSSHAILAIVG